MHVGKDPTEVAAGHVKLAGELSLHGVRVVVQGRHRHDEFTITDLGGRAIPKIAARWVAPEEFLVAAERDEEGDLRAGDVERLALIPDRPSVVAPDIDANLGLVDGNGPLIEDGDVNRELTDEVFPQVVWRRVQEVVGIDGVDLPPRAGLVALELGPHI